MNRLILQDMIDALESEAVNVDRLLHKAISDSDKLHSEISNLRKRLHETDKIEYQADNDA